MARPSPPRDDDTRLPNGGRADLDIRKLTDYCPRPDHSRGRHKARVFRDALVFFGRPAMRGLFGWPATNGASAARSMSRSRDKTGAPWYERSG